jgi:hypothetical protein
VRRARAGGARSGRGGRAHRGAHRGLPGPDPAAGARRRGSREAGGRSGHRGA